MKHQSTKGCLYWGGAYIRNYAVIHGWRMDGWVVGWMGGWMDEWVVGWMDGWMDGWILHIFYNAVCTITMYNIILSYQCTSI